MPKKTRYESDRDRKGRDERISSRDSRDIGAIPPVKNRRRRKKADGSLLFFLQTYFPDTFNLGWSDDQRQQVADAEAIIDDGGQQATAAPRGDGKTSRAVRKAMWALLTGRRRFVMMIAAEQGLAESLVAVIRSELQFNDLLAEDYPEVCYPIRRLENITKRQQGQTIGDKPTLIKLTAGEIVLPTVSRSKASGGIIRAVGLTGSVRGQIATTGSGETVRPDLVLIDDPQTREALDVETLIPTPSGFKRMGDLTAGDTVFDDSGMQCRVTEVSEVYQDRDCYRVVFDDGAEVVADAGHLWVTSTALQRTNERRKVVLPSAAFASRPQCQAKPFRSVRTTVEIAATMTGEGGRSNHSVPLAGAFDLPNADLPIPPYTLGVWLGDGDSGSNRITTADSEILDFIRSDGFGIGKECRKPNNRAAAYTVLGLRKLLRQEDLVGNKHLPTPYMFASRQQRLAVLQGLMDTDGCVSLAEKGLKGSRCNFSNTNRRLIDSVLHLCRSLGIKAKCASMPQRTKTNASPIWVVSFITAEQVFRLPRKVNRLPHATRPDTRRRFVVAVEPVESRPVRCIAVDSPSQMYLCGKEMVPTHNSARSPTQVNYRLNLLNSDVLGLAGPGKKIACFALTTVIYSDDLSDKLLDREANPAWGGRRYQLLKSLPSCMDLWDEYAEVRRASLREHGDNRDGNAFYESRRESMDAGAVASWPDRFNPDELSAVQSAMNIKIDRPSAFASEYQNAPLAEDVAAGVKFVESVDVAKRLNGADRGTVPPGCTRVTAFVDCGADVLWYAVTAWNEWFGGAVIDCGPWPRQNRSHFAAADARPSLRDVHPGMNDSQRVYAALASLVPRLLGQAYPAGGGELWVDRLLIDAGWETDAVYQYVLSSPHVGVIYPSKGVGRSTTQAGVGRWKQRPGERSGHHWRLTNGEANGRRVRSVQFDPDEWKGVVHAALTVPVGGPTGLTLWGKDSVPHELLADHLAAEFSTPMTLRGETFDKWQLRPHRPDNHLLDCVVGCAVAASVQGLQLKADGSASGPPAERKRVKLSDLMKRRQPAAGGE
jgi:hypothetical protein